MKKFLIIGLALIFVFYIGTSMSLALIVDLFDWAFYVDGTIYKFTEGDTMPTTGTLDSSGLGTLTWSISNAGSHKFIAFFDHEIDEPENTSFNEYGTSHQPLASGQSWEIDEPGYFFGDIYDNVLAGSLDNTNGVPPGSTDDVSMALGWNFSLAEGETATITLELADVAPSISCLYLSHTDPDSGGYTIYYSSTLDITGPITVDMIIKKNWSMISLPVEFEDPASGNVLLQNSVVMYGFEKVTGYKCVTTANDLDVGKGYWILSDQNQTLTLTGKTIQSHTLTVVEDGWVMIGGCTSPAEALTDDCNIRVIYGYAPEVGYKRLLAGENLQPEKGYWILLEDVTGQCTLTVGETTENGL